MEEPREIGEWIVVSVLGSGSFGVVKLWRNSKNDDFIAVKKCRVNTPTKLTKRQRERWTNEVKIMRSIKNENIVAFKELPEILEKELSNYNTTQLPLLSMEYCSKGNLRTYLSQSENVKGMRETEVRFVLQDMCNAVSYLHGLNVTHRDIKPENIVLQETNERPNGTVYKLIDLGYAKELETLVQSFVGTLQYLAPEIFNTENYNNKVDYWSLGIVAFEVITGIHPFLHNLAPAERFQHIQQKSPETICIYASRNGIKSFDQIVLENHISHVFKVTMESWLKLVLQFDPKMRGVVGGETKDVFLELENIIKKRIIKVFSVFNYECRSYEIGDTTTLCDIKTFIERELHVAASDQIILAEKFFLRYDDAIRIVDCFSEINHETALYVFKRDECIEVKIIELPDLIKVLFDNGQKEFNQIVLKQLFSYSIYFISQEDNLLTALKCAFSRQTDRLEFLFREETQVFMAVRGRLLKLTVQIECLDKINQKFMDAVDATDEKCSQNLILYRKYLRQSKELIENVNSLTARHLKLHEKQTSLENVTQKLKSFLNDADVRQSYLAALRMYEQLGTNKFTIQDMSKIVSAVIKIRCKVWKNDILKEYTRFSWHLMRNFEKQFTWMEALEKEIDEISNCICLNVYDKYDLVCDKSAKGQTKQKIRISLPIEIPEDILKTETLIKENTRLRYDIQDLMSEALRYRR